ncbi:fatty acid desaturase [Flaviaesturariibacter amylovorans]|uniref:Fatty acid desaturase domain-containing protein n=1 Tax=Flaviaesturariibacter amylovorans TaxID=1084520 RepID=A0ABP8HKJ0_9BACT
MSKNVFIDNLLETPSYGWQDAEGRLIIPTTKQLWAEAARRINIFRTRKNWISAISVIMMICMIPFAVAFGANYFSWPLAIGAVAYGMVVMGTHGTIWFHRYCTHRAYTFRHPIVRILTQHLVIKTFPEEMYVISHHVHHVKSDLPGDPYNPQGGLMYCMLSETNHHSINKNLCEAHYAKAARFMQHTGVQINSYEQYKRWASIATPQYTVFTWLINWAFWYTAFYFIGGHALATALFSGALLWYIGVRAFNYTGHGKGEVKHKDGIDFDRSNLSINQSRPGLLAGEWHNNHHLYPGSARAGFLKGQLDLAWLYIYSLYKLKLVSSYKDSKAEFLRKYALKGHARDMKPLSGTAYTRAQLEEEGRRLEEESRKLEERA